MRARLAAHPLPPPAQLVHGDVFRFPPQLNLFCAVVGTGTQILAMALLIFGMSLLGTYYPYNGGAMLTSVVVFYALTAGIAGYVSAALYKIMGGEGAGAGADARHSQ
jgi:energy-converting hydrogenase Eha subunit G